MPTLRKPKIPRVVVQSARTPAERFKKPNECWNQSSLHHKYFIQTLKCDKDYHEDKNACKVFDNWIAKVAGLRYKKVFFNYYFVNPTSRPPSPQFYTSGIISDQSLLNRIATFSITRQPPGMVANLPEMYAQWPADFTFEHDVFLSPTNKKRMKCAIEACIKRRVWFRKECVLNCSKDLDTKSHEQFLLILQILRAKLLVYYNA